MFRLPALLLAALTLSSCGMITGIKEPALLHAEHPLVGRIWDVRTQSFVSRQQLAGAIVQSQNLLLGETHDNPIHHQHQARLIDHLNDSRRSAVTLFEMIDDKQAGLMLEKAPQTADDLIEVLNQVTTSWRYDPRYKPVFESTIRGGHPILPASLERDQILAIIRRGEEEIPGQISTMLDRTPLSAEQQTSLEREIEASHCGMLHGGMAAGMVRAQRVKDAVMAQRMSSRDDVDIRVLVAGSGHTRKDRGVPLYLTNQAGSDNTLSVTWLEVLPDAISPAVYAGHWGSERLPFDYVWFTPRVERDDPCAAMRQHFKKDS